MAAMSFFCVLFTVICICLRIADASCQSSGVLQFVPGKPTPLQIPIDVEDNFGEPFDFNVNGSADFIVCVECYFYSFYMQEHVHQIRVTIGGQNNTESKIEQLRQTGNWSTLVTSNQLLLSPGHYRRFRVSWNQTAISVVSRDVQENATQRMEGTFLYQDKFLYRDTLIDVTQIRVHGNDTPYDVIVHGHYRRFRVSWNQTAISVVSSDDQANTAQSMEGKFLHPQALINVKHIMISGGDTPYDVVVHGATLPAAFCSEPESNTIPPKCTDTETGCAFFTTSTTETENSTSRSAWTTASLSPTTTTVTAATNNETINEMGTSTATATTTNEIDTSATTTTNNEISTSTANSTTTNEISTSSAITTNNEIDTSTAKTTNNEIGTSTATPTTTNEIGTSAATTTNKEIGTSAATTTNNEIGTSAATTTNSSHLCSVKLTKEQKPCRCVNKRTKITPSKLDLEELTVDRRQTAAKVRRRTSAQDHRPSSTSIGVMAVVFAAVPLVVALIFDVVNAFVKFRCHCHRRCRHSPCRRCCCHAHRRTHRAEPEATTSSAEAEVKTRAAETA